MGANQDQQVSGPDLARGIPAESVPEGALLAGHVGGEAVLLTRCGGTLHAIGATCPHYGAPLADGLVVDGTIRCPWHHAAFDVRTGHAVREPALNDLPCWSVMERDGVATVTGRREAPPRPSRHGSRDAPSSVVVVGGGAAGAVAVETLRREGYAGAVTLLTAEPTPPVDRPNLSKDYLAGNAPADWIPLRPEGWYREHEITVRTNARVEAIDVRSRRATLSDGSAVPWGALLIATGASPIRLPLGDPARVHYLRTLADADGIIAAAAAARRAVVIGASFIGLEVAASLRTRGLDVTVVAPEHVPLERVLGAEVGAWIRELHEQRGVGFRLGRTVRGADAHGVVLDDGARVEGDLIVAGVGVRPNVDLAQQAGLHVDRAILVDEYLESSVRGIYAAGDVAAWPDRRAGRPIRVEHWVVAERQGATAARNILGARERFDAVPFFWSAHYDATVAYVGHAAQPGRIEIDGDLRALDCAVRYFEGDRVAAVATVGRDRDALLAEARMEHDAPAAAGVA